MAIGSYFKKILALARNGLISTKKILWIVGMHAFATILVLVLIDVLFAGFLLYKNVLLAEQEKPGIDNTDFQFRDGAYQDILIQWQAREEQLDEFSEKDYTSPF